MAHLNELPRHRCRAVGCDRFATCELINDRSAPVGYYCRRHGERELAAFEHQRDERHKPREPEHSLVRALIGDPWKERP